MRWIALACSGLLGCGLTLDLSPPVDAGSFDGSADAGMDAAPDAPGCTSDDECLELVPAVGECFSRCIGDVCLLPDMDGDGVGPGCADERDCDDLDPSIQLNGVRSCDLGRVGACNLGATQVCVDGVLGDCEGGREPVPESCNGLDDDCDGSVDGLVIDGLGEGMCMTSYRCDDGSWATSSPPVTGDPDGCTAIGADVEDDDCDGSFDEDCVPTGGTCVYMRAFAPTFSGDIVAATDPSRGVQSMADALRAISMGAPPAVCLLAQGGSGARCTPTTYVIGTPIPGNVAVIGNLVLGPAAVEQCSRDDATILRTEGSGGVSIIPDPAGLGEPAALIDLTVHIPPGEGGDNVRGVRVTSGASLVMDRVRVVSGDFLGRPASSRGIRVEGSASLIAIRSRVEGGRGFTAFGIDAAGDVALINSCGSASCRPSCSGESDAVFGGSFQNDGAAIRMNDGELFASRYAVCQLNGPTGIQSRATGTTLLDSLVVTSGNANQVRGVQLVDCADSWIHASIVEVNVSNGASLPKAYGVETGGDCLVALTQNPTIVGAASGFVDEALGVSCGSTCALDSNAILGARSGVEASIATGVACGPGCEMILHRNDVRGSASALALEAFGLYMEGRVGVVSDNRILGGCGEALTAGTSIANGNSRLENNVMLGHDDCETAAETSIGMDVQGGAVDVNGNTISGGVPGASAAIDCAAFGLVVDATRTAIRNNVFTGGPGCGESIAVEAEQRPFAFDHNGLTHGPFDDGRDFLTTPGELLGLDASWVGNVFTDSPGFASYPADLRIGAGSPFAGAGTTAGAPSLDQDGTVRPVPPSMGAFEP